MTRKESIRAQIIARVIAKTITQREASNELKLCIRQVIRLCHRYRAEGVRGLVSKKRGLPSSRRMPDKERARIIEVLRTQYEDCGPTFACEKLQENHGVQIGLETTRQLMISADLWKSGRRKRLTLHAIRTRRSRQGELVQMDASDHCWFGDTKCSLLSAIDDATSSCMLLQFVADESTDAYLDFVKNYLRRYGRPVSYYTDRHSVFRINTKGVEERTQFGRALNELQIELIFARSPQAKGRVERAFRTLQDRLVKELRLRGITTIDEANLFLEQYRKDHNRKFAKSPQSAQNAHRPLAPGMDLEEILIRKATRRLSSNLTFQFENELYQIKTDRPIYAMRGAEVTLLLPQQGRPKVIYKGKPLKYEVYRCDMRNPVMDSKNLTAFLNRKTRQSAIGRVRKARSGIG